MWSVGIQPAALYCHTHRNILYNVVSENLASMRFAATFLSLFFFPLYNTMHKGVQTTAGCVVCGSVPPLRGEQCRPCLVLCVLSGEEGCDKVHLLLSEVLPGSTCPSQFSLLLPFFFLPSPTIKKWSFKSNIDFFFFDSGCTCWHKWELWG